MWSAVARWWRRCVDEAGPVSLHTALGFKCLPHKLFLLGRVAVTLFLLVAWIWTLATEDMRYYFFYFTNLSYMTVVAYFIVNTVLTVQDSLCSELGRPSYLPHVDNYGSDQTRQQPDADSGRRRGSNVSNVCVTCCSSATDTEGKMAAFWLTFLYELVLVEQTIVIGLYWALLASPGEVGWITTTLHGWGGLAVVLDAFLFPRKFLLWHLPMWLGVCLCYLIWCFIASAALPPRNSDEDKYWVYWFLDTSRRGAGGWYVGLILLFIFWWIFMSKLHALLVRCLCAAKAIQVTPSAALDGGDAIPDQVDQQGSIAAELDQSGQNNGTHNTTSLPRP
eukprot:g68253.t1